MLPTRRDILALAAATAAWPIARAIGQDTPPRKLKLLILGGTGFLGPHLVRVAVERGHEMTLFNRGVTNPHLFPELEKLRGDRRTSNLDALRDRSWDAVIDTSAYYPRVVDEATSLLAERVRQYVFVSTISVYAKRDIIGMDETAPLATIEDESTEQVSGLTYGPLKVLCERAAETAMPGRVLTVRPGLIVGPGDTTDRFTYWPVRVARGGEVLAPGTGDDPVQFIDARDLALWTIDSIEQGRNGVFNATGPVEPITMRGMLEACREATGSDAEFTWVDREFLAEQSVRPWSDMPVWVPPVGEYAGFGRTSIERAKRAGLTTRPAVETARDTEAWFRTLEPSRQARLSGAAVYPTPQNMADDSIPKRRAGLSLAREQAVLDAWRTR